MGVPVKVLDRKRPCYRPDVWHKYRLLTNGGHEIDSNKGLFIRQNPAESSDWYRERAARFEYKNIVGTIVGEYTGSIFRAGLQVMRSKGDQESRPELGEYYSALMRDPKGDGENDFSLTMRDSLREAFICQETWLLVDMPSSERSYSSRAEQEAAGDLSMRICPVSPERVLRYGWDRYGLAWVMLHYEKPNDDPFAEESKERIWRWTYMDRKIVRTFQIAKPKDETPSEEEIVDEIEQHTHKLADANGGRGAVPMLRMKLKPELWMVDRIASIACAETRKRNELGWYESIACVPQLKHAGDSNFNEQAEYAESGDRPKRGVQYVLEYEKDGALDWLEASGSCLSHMDGRLDKLEADAYKAVSQMATAEGAGSSAAVLARSGASKARDAIAKVILCTQYASTVRDWAVQIMDLVSASRGDTDHEWEAAGLDQHDMVDPGETTSWYAEASAIRWSSETMAKELEKLAARQLLQGSDMGTLDTIESEIDAAKRPDDDSISSERMLEDLDAMDRAESGAKRSRRRGTGSSAAA